jgi:hypothetical protein
MLGACGAALRRRSELLLIYAFYHNLSDDERSFSLWHTNLKPVANRATLQRIEGDPLDVPRWRGRGDLKHEGGSTCRGCRSIALCEALSARRGSGQCRSRIERDVETNPTGSRCVVASVVLRYTCVRARCVSVDITDHTHTHTASSSHAPRAWQQPRRRAAVAAPAASAGTLGTRPPPVLATSGGSASRTKHNINPLT